MKRELISKALGQLDAELIAEALTYRGARRDSAPERTENMNKSRRNLKRIPALILAACLLLALAVTAYAVGQGWSRGIRQRLSATDAQQEALTEQGLASADGLEGLAVTCGGVTVRPLELIADEHDLLISFEIEGFALKAGEEPGFGDWQFYTGDDPREGFLSGSGEFCYMVDENGQPIFADESGKLELVWRLYDADPKDSLMGKTFHASLRDLGISAKADFVPEVSGEWDFTLRLPEASAAEEFPVGCPVEGTAFTVETVKLSPISVQIEYSVSGAVSVADGELGIPQFCGLVLKDGTELRLWGGGASGYTDETLTAAYAMAGLTQVVEPEAVAALLLRDMETGTLYRIPIA